MKRSNIIGIIAAAVVIIVSVVLITAGISRRSTLTLIQGTVECTTYKASSKVPGRIDDMKVAQGDRVEKGSCSTRSRRPNWKPSSSRPKRPSRARPRRWIRPLAGARIQQIEAAMNMWEKAQAGLELARKTYERVKNLYEQGVVPRTEDGRSVGQLQSHGSHGAGRQSAVRSGHGRRPQGGQGGRRGPCPSGRRSRQRSRSYISDAMVYSPVTGEVSTIIAEQGELVGSGYPWWRSST